MRTISALVLGLFCASVSTPLMAQVPAAQNIAPAEKPASPGVVSGFALDFLNDQKAIWTSPLHITGSDVKLLAPAGAALGTLFVFDHRISNAAKANTSLRTPSNAISNFGEFYPYATAGTLWLVGGIKHNDHAAEAGRLATEAELDSEVVMNVIKIATGRTRPNFADNRSFPSGHAMSSFALAAVLSREYHDKPVIVYGSYGLATAISLARVGGLNHFPSDVLAGAVIGELIGRYVVHHHASQLPE